MMNTCPVCGMEKIAPEKTECPQCDADLTCFKVLDSLSSGPAALVEPAREKAARGKQGIFYAVILLFLGLITLLSVVQVYRFKGLESRFVDRETSLMDGMSKINARLGLLGRSRSIPSKEIAAGPDTVIRTKDQAKALSVPETQSAHRVQPETASIEHQAFFSYRADENDTLWDIAEKYYGSGDYYPVLLEHNPHLGIYDIGDGTEVEILEDVGLVKGIYRKIVERKGARVYLYHTLCDGDTLLSVARRFYKEEDMAARIADLNPDAAFEPGERIRVELE